MMTGSERRTAIINQIKNSTVPVSGKALAAQYAVSRQVIVQDIALIRAAGHEIIPLTGAIFSMRMHPYSGHLR